MFKPGDSVKVTSKDVPKLDGKKGTVCFSFWNAGLSYSIYIPDNGYYLFGEKELVKA